MKGLGWLSGGNDRALAATRYSGQQSATDSAAQKNQKKRTKALKQRAKGIQAADRAGQAWEAADRRRFGG